MNSIKEIASTPEQIRLAGQMHEARQAYQEAAADYASVRAKYGHMLDHPDGAAALLKSAQSVAQCSHEYAVAIKAWGENAAASPRRFLLWAESRSAIAH
jgi:hypothetical protein